LTRPIQKCKEIGVEDHPEKAGLVLSPGAPSVSMRVRVPAGEVFLCAVC
jgi:hypothetical protein